MIPPLKTWHDEKVETKVAQVPKLAKNKRSTQCLLQQIWRSPSPQLHALQKLKKRVREQLLDRAKNPIWNQKSEEGLYQCATVHGLGFNVLGFSFGINSKSHNITLGPRKIKEYTRAHPNFQESMSRFSLFQRKNGRVKVGYIWTLDLHFSNISKTPFRTLTHGSQSLQNLVLSFDTYPGF